MDTELAYTPYVYATQAYGHSYKSQAYGHSYKSQYIVLTCCTAAQTRSVLNVALSSPYTTAIECFLGCLCPSHRRRLDISIAPRGLERQHKMPLYWTFTISRPMGCER